MSDKPVKPSDGRMPPPLDLPASDRQPGEAASAAATRGSGDTQRLVDARILPSVWLSETSQTLREDRGILLDGRRSQDDRLKAAAELSAAGVKEVRDNEGHTLRIDSSRSGTHTDVRVRSGDAGSSRQPFLSGTVSDDSTAGHSGAPQPSPEQQKLLADMQSRGIKPPSATEGDRLALIRDEAATARAGDREQAPLHDRLVTVGSELSVLERSSPLDAAYKAGETLNADLKANGFQALNFDRVGTSYVHADEINRTRQAVESSTSLPADTKQRLLAEFHDHETATAASDKWGAEHQQRAIDQHQTGVKLDQSMQRSDTAQSESERKLRETGLRDDLSHIDQLPEQQRRGVYDALGRIAADQGNGPNQLSADQRKQLIEDLAHQIAHPDAIRQGNRLTCGAGQVEDVLARTDPSKYASVVADLATRGETLLGDGSRMRLDASSINVQNADGSRSPQNDGNVVRSLASKIFQTAVTAKAVDYQSERTGEFAGHYVNGSSKGPNDPGEYLQNADGSRSSFGGLNFYDVTRVLSGLTGKQYEHLDATTQPGTEDSAAFRLLRLASTSLPMPMWINVTGGDFTGNTPPGAEPYGHAITVTRLGSVNGQPAVYFDSSASRIDHSYPTGTPVPLREFLRSTRPDLIRDGTLPPTYVTPVAPGTR